MVVRRWRSVDGSKPRPSKGFKLKLMFIGLMYIVGHGKKRNSDTIWGKWQMSESKLYCIKLICGRSDDSHHIYNIVRIQAFML